MAPIRQIGTKIVYENRWMRVREDAVVFADGVESIYGVVEKSDYVVIAAIEHDRLHLVEQYRYPVGGRYWELPQGSREGNVDVDPLELARAELREETGLTAKTMVDAGRLFQGYGYSTQSYAVFCAMDLEQGQQELEASEADLVTQSFTVGEVETMIRDGVIQDATTVAAFGLLRLKGFLPTC